MTVEKWFARSRRLWSLATPLIAAVWLLHNPNIDQVALEGHLSALDVLLGHIEAFVLLGAGTVSGLWSMARPDGATLKLVPSLPKLGGGGGGGTLLAFAVLLLAGCASSLEGQFWQAHGMATEAKRGYRNALESDNRQMRLCFEAHSGDALASCPPWIPVAKRELANAISKRVAGDLDSLEPLIGRVGAFDERAVAEAIGVIEASTVELILLYGGNPR